ncbi:MAG: glycosyltransferase family 4 protein [Gloeobacteraceae cyanobacterium ES-bin-316]|nr:glycosyltransferase family 4 protein [Ferruginibacter sp.]
MEIVALEIIRHLQKLNQPYHFIIFAKKGTDSDCIQETVNFSINKTPAKPYPIWEQFFLPKIARKNKLDILHCTSNTAPIFCKSPLIITLHDIIFLEKLDFSGSSYQNFGNLYRRFIVPRVAKNARLIITVSDFSRKLIMQKLNIPPQKIKVIYNGVSELYKKINEENGIAEFRKKYNLPAHFFLHFGNTAPRKNTLGTLKAYILLSKKTPDTWPLVITSCQREYLISLLKKIDAPEYINKVLCLDYIAADELPYLYNAASIFLYPSLNEGFGMPVIEAMACGTPVITSNISCLPEIAGDAAVLIDPYNTTEIAAKMKELAQSNEMYFEKQQLGLRNAERFSWKIAAEKTLSVYNEVLNNASN